MVHWWIDLRMDRFTDVTLDQHDTTSKKTTVTYNGARIEKNNGAVKKRRVMCTEAGIFFSGARVFE